MEFSRQEYWSVVPLASPGNLSEQGIEPGSPACRQILYSLNHQVHGILQARILKWVAFSSSSALESRRVSLGAHWVDPSESSLLRRLERGREIGL